MSHINIPSIFRTVLASAVLVLVFSWHTVSGGKFTNALLKTTLEPERTNFTIEDLLAVTPRPKKPHSPFVPFIVNGDVARVEELTYTALIVAKGSKCTGSVIAPRYVITSAHCHSKSRPIQGVGFGFHDLDVYGEVIYTEQVFVHPLYNTVNQSEWKSHDIAIVKLQREISLPNVQQILLSKYKQYEDTNELGTVAGWGRTDPLDSRSTSKLLLKAKNPILTTEKCKEEILNKVVLMSELSHMFGESGEELGDLTQIDSSHVCSKALNGSSVSKGDSGGPLMVKKNGKDVLIGVTSGGLLYNPLQVPYVYASVANAYDFIEEHSVGHVWFEDQNLPNHLQP